VCTYTSIYFKADNAKNCIAYFFTLLLKSKFLLSLKFRLGTKPKLDQ